MNGGRKGNKGEIERNKRRKEGREKNRKGKENKINGQLEMIKKKKRMHQKVRAHIEVNENMVDLIS